MQEAETDNPSPSIFAKYACQWFPPMVDVLTSGKSQAAGIHYMLRDAILVLLSWPSLWPPIGRNAQLTRGAANCLMEHLVSSAASPELANPMTSEPASCQKLHWMALQNLDRQQSIRPFGGKATLLYHHHA